MRADPENVARVLAVLERWPQHIGRVGVRAGLPRRRVEEAIEAIRREGQALVCSGPEGVWLARSTQEAEANVERRRRRAITQLLTLRGERRLLRRLLRRLAMPGQGRLWS